MLTEEQIYNGACDDCESIGMVVSDWQGNNEIEDWDGNLIFVENGIIVGIKSWGCDIIGKSC